MAAYDFDARTVKPWLGVENETPVEYATRIWVAAWTCHGLVPPQVLVYATFRSKATGLFQPSAECLRRGL